MKTYYCKDCGVDNITTTPDRTARCPKCKSTLLEFKGYTYVKDKRHEFNHKKI